MTGYGTECSGDTLGPGGDPDHPGCRGGRPARRRGQLRRVAMIANVTAVSGTADTYFTLYPADMALPNRQ